MFQCGFFRRKGREELQKLIDTSSHAEERESLHPGPPSSPTTPTPQSPLTSELPPPFSSLEADDVMVLPPTNSFFPDPAQQTPLLRNNNHVAAPWGGADFLSHAHQRSCTLGYPPRPPRSGNGVNGAGAGVMGGMGSVGSLGRHRALPQQPQHHWLPPPPPPALPSFNNQLYLEPLEHTV